MTNIRNFVIIAHVDHGKSTLADRLLEATGTVPERRMRPQYLDQLELERERGITIKMAPVRMTYFPAKSDQRQGYLLNLIDTPGHSDFGYEVSRALAAVEGAVLLVDVTKGIQAQTLSNFRQAKANGLSIIGAVNKVDLDAPRADQVAASLAELLGVAPADILRISGKTGIGVPALLEAIVKNVPPPSSRRSFDRALIFDSLYNDHKGILAYVRVVDGEVRAGDEVVLLASGARVSVKEVGYFAPQFTPTERLAAGEIGYIATGVKEPAQVRIGDTVVSSATRLRQGFAGQASDQGLALAGYKEVSPVVFISFYPDGQTKFDDMKKAFERLHLTDAALTFEPDANEALGRGLKAGFLGQLHFEIAASRLADEFGLSFITSFPSIAYEVRRGSDVRVIKDAHDFPADYDEVREPMIAVEILAPTRYVSAIANLKQTFALGITSITTMGENAVIEGMMPLVELIRDFDDQLKSVSAGYASFSYELAGYARADVAKLEILVAGEPISALTRIVYRADIEREGRATVERLKKLLPAQQFAQALQASAGGRIVARETIAAMRKDVTGYLYGGDRTRKMKLWRKQKRGKERLKEHGKVDISPQVFRELLKK